MKKYILLSLLFIACYFAQAQDGQAILTTLHNQQIAWNKGDIESFMQGYWKSDSLVFVGKAAPLYGWQNTLNRYKKAYPGKEAMGQLIFGVLKLDVLDSKNAFMLGSWHLTRKAGALGGYFTLWFKKTNGEWKIVCDHTS